MPHGIETDDKKYKHKKRNEIKWLAEDLYEIRKTYENYIDSIRPDEKKEKSSTVTKEEKTVLTSVRVVQILILGILGSIILIGGVYMFMKDNNVVSIPLVLIGAVFVIALVLNVIYRK